MQYSMILAVQDDPALSGNYIKSLLNLNLVFYDVSSYP